MLHCIGGENEMGEKTDYHFSIKLNKIYLKNGGLLVFENWFRLLGFNGFTKDLGKMVNDYAGNLDFLE